VTESTSAKKVSFLADEIASVWTTRQWRGRAKGMFCIWSFQTLNVWRNSLFLQGFENSPKRFSSRIFSTWKHLPSSGFLGKKKPQGSWTDSGKVACYDECGSILCWDNGENLMENCLKKRLSW